MSNQNDFDGYTVSRIPRNRNLVEDMLREGKKKHHVNTFHGLDISAPKEMIGKSQKDSGIKISFTSYLIKCVAQAIDEHKKIHSFIGGFIKSRLVTFNTVDVSLFIEKKLDRDESIPVLYIVRNAQIKSVQEISAEIRVAQENCITEGDSKTQADFRKSERLSSLPTCIRKIVWWVLMHSPSLFKKHFGTAVVSSIGMFQSDFSQAVSTTVWPFALIVGGIGHNLEGNSSINKETLGITMCIDHMVIDGAPAARFVDRLVNLIKTGSCLLP
jgi:pyruvate/2-oxoglutarate dehydrogenase complex dihydrolipoamide acyltransferase (E2) component